MDKNSRLFAKEPNTYVGKDETGCCKFVEETKWQLPFDEIWEMEHDLQSLYEVA